MKIKGKILKNMIGVILVFTAGAPFLYGASNLTENVKINNIVKSDSDIWSKDALPCDLFGDWSYPKFWKNKHSDEVLFEKPSEWWKYKKYSSHEGIGLQSTKNYTKDFNTAILNGYTEGIYYDKYIDAVANNPEGWYLLEPDWILNDVDYYLEDFLVWNCNTNTEQEWITWNDDIALDWSTSDHSIVSIDDKDGFEPISNYNLLGLTIGGLEEEYGVLTLDFNSRNNTPFFDWEQRTSPTEFLFHTNHITNYSVNIENKEDICDGRITNDWLQKEILKFSNETLFSDFKNQFENDLFLKLNEQFINDYEIEALGHDKMQGVKTNEEDIGINDLEMNYYDNLGNLITDNKKLKEYESIKMDLKSHESFFVKENEIKAEINTANSKNSSLLPLWITIGVSGTTSLIGLSSFTFYKMSKNEKK